MEGCTSDFQHTRKESYKIIYAMQPILLKYAQ